jgi:hypothetical protein
MRQAHEQQDYESLKQADKLDREPLIKNLTKILETIPSPFVMSINASWGMGKTTMLRLWEAYLHTQEFQCFYFNAWEHDFGSQPLVALMAQFQIFVEEFKNTGKQAPVEALDNIISKSKAFIKRAAPLAGKVALKVITRDSVNSEELKDLFATISFDDKDVETLGDGLGDVAKSEIERYVSQQTTLKEFREGLKNFAELVSGYTKSNKPLVIFIDELDRCRPNYAIELLETVKHLFSVEGIVFVLGVDMEQLGKSASVLYGTQMDTAGYFRRLIEYEFMLSTPDKFELIKHYGSHYLQVISKRKFIDLVTIHHLVTVFANSLDMSLRNVETMFKRLQIVLPICIEDELEQIHFIILVIAIKLTSDRLYAEFQYNGTLKQGAWNKLLRSTHVQMISNIPSVERVPTVEERLIENLNKGFHKKDFTTDYWNKILACIAQYFNVKDTDMKAEIKHAVNKLSGDEATRIIQKIEFAYQFNL